LKTRSRPTVVLRTGVVEHPGQFFARQSFNSGDADQRGFASVVAYLLGQPLKSLEIHRLVRQQVGRGLELSRAKLLELAPQADSFGALPVGQAIKQKQSLARNGYSGPPTGCHRCFNLEHLREPLRGLLHSNRLLVILRTVNLLRFIIAPLLVAFWLPASSHPLLQYAGLIHARHADHDADSSASHEHNEHDHDAADGLCALSSTHVSVPIRALVATGFLPCLVGLGWVSEHDVELRPSGLSPPGTAPSHFSHRWQFSFRTALLPRAPSVIS
jgi:hypothetical protein